MIHVNFKINLRWVLRPICRLNREHVLQQVWGADAFSRSYTYCKRCGQGWRTQGLFPFPRVVLPETQDTRKPRTSQVRFKRR